jgi:hypothetical protein
MSVIDFNHNGEKLVYAVNDSGHRRSYLDIFEGMFGLDILVGRSSIPMLFRLIRARSILFATLDDDVFSFIFVASVRSLFNKPTVALFLRAEKCFESSKWHHFFKRITFSFIRNFRGLNIATITPFSSAPQYMKIANMGLYDPQYWDIYDDPDFNKSNSTSLSLMIENRSNGRKVCCILGSLTSIKGLSFINETLEKYPKIMGRIFFVFAGKSTAFESKIMDSLKEKDTLVVDRFISNDEMSSAYTVADIIWCCYAPEYNQASGIFGRAIQLKKYVIVRENSIISQFSKKEAIKSLFLVEYHDTKSLFNFLMNNDYDFNYTQYDIFRDWKVQFYNKVNESLVL